MDNNLSKVLKELKELQEKQVKEYESLVHYLTAYDYSKLSNSQNSEDFNHNIEH